MNRRNVLKAFALAAGGESAWAKGTAKRSSTAKTFRFPYVETADRSSLFFKDWGTGNPVLFIHGWALNSDMWQYQMIHLASQGVRCLAYDCRGHGRSSDPGRGYDFDTLADDLASFIEQLDLRDVVLVGHSIGGAEIARYLSRHGSARVARALFLAPSMPFVLKTADNPDGVEQKILSQVRASMSADFPKWLGDNAPPFFVKSTSPETVEWGIRMCLQASLKAVLDLNRADAQTDFRPDLRKINIPVLVIHGDSDHSAPLDRTGRRTAQLIQGGELKVYEGGPHGLFITHMERLNQDLLAFVRGAA